MFKIRKQAHKWQIGLILASILIIMITSSIKQGLTPKLQNVAGANPSPQPALAEDASHSNISQGQSFIATSPAPTETLSNRVTPLKLGIVVNDYANRLGTLSSLESQLNYSFSTVSIYKQFGHPYNSRLNLEDLNFTKSSHKKLLIAWEPWNPEQGTRQTRDYLREIPSGALDEYLTQFANDIRNYNGPVIIRFGHEMNGNWYPWGNRPEAYQLAYRYIIDFFKKAQTSNVKWMWSINAESLPAEPIAESIKYYPGDNYVDIIGIDGFNFGNSRPGYAWTSFPGVFSPAYQFINSNFDKPIVISEIASAEQGGNKSEWVQEMFRHLKTDFIEVEEVIWFNLLKEADWRIESTDATFKAFKDSL